MGAVIIIQIGLALPQMPDIAATLVYRITTTYPAIVFTSIGIELILVHLFICIRWWDALRIYVQRDDKTSNAPWLLKILGIYRVPTSRIQTNLSREIFTFSKAMRTGTSAMERKIPGGPSEMQHLTQVWSEEPESMNTGNAGARGGSVADDQSEPTPAADTISQSSGVDPLSRSGTNMPSNQRVGDAIPTGKAITDNQTPLPTDGA
ncbi:hypothetical protein HO133_009918 [Letharia lupina]|uniref:Uncharacterized protein n=1 Tax=Letharia lupina TaxID=560253 RepID=A0A8H6CJW6_9LECA|nr:uncharacterized protein HO133_009918 [Letharia lupina]KAF6224725.1 hypothetical protein HO133_009918 [Letharia lupina]